MGRGTATISDAILYGATGPRGIGLDESQEIKLSPKQEVALRGLFSLSREHPSAPGFEAYDICDAASPLEQRQEQWLNVNTTGPVLSSLQQKGLVERSRGCFKGASGQISDSESGWTLTARGSTMVASL
jgi:hypothetical protein